MKRYVMMDDAWVDRERSSTFRIVVNPPTRIQRVLTPDLPWERRYGIPFFGQVLETDASDPYGPYRLYYRFQDRFDRVIDQVENKGIKPSYWALAVSQNGIQWTKPALGLVEAGGSTANNLVMRDTSAACVFVDPKAPAEQRYKCAMCFLDGGYGITGVSSDGVTFNPVRWPLVPNAVDGRPYHLDTHNILFWDDRLGRYVVFMRGYHGGTLVDGRWKHMARSVQRAETPDLLTPFIPCPTERPYLQWPGRGHHGISTEYPCVMATRSDECAAWSGSDDAVAARPLVSLYNTSACRYPWADDVYLAFPSVYYRTGPNTNPVGTDGNDGLFEVELATSRDSVNWTRYRRFDGHQPYVPLWDHAGPVCGRDAARGLLHYGPTGRQDGVRPTYLVSMEQGMFRQGDEIWQYFHALAATHGKAAELNGRFDKIFKDPADSERELAWAHSDKGGIYLARQRLDGFACIDATTTAAIVTTKPVSWERGTLRLNAAVLAGGCITVRVVDANGAPFSPEAGESEPVTGDAVAQVVTWTSRRLPIAGNSVRLVFEMKRARLFAFEFEDDPPARIP